MLTDRFPTRAEIRRAAQVYAYLRECELRGVQAPTEMIVEAEQHIARYRSLGPMERELCERTFNADVSDCAQAAQQWMQQQVAQDAADRADALTRELTRGMAGRGEGLTVAQAAALRAGDRPKLRVNKLPTGKAADARVRAATGLTTKQYEELLDEARVERNMHKYTNPARYEAYLAQHFPGHDPREVDRLLGNWLLESVGLEMRRRAERDQPDAVGLRGLTGEEARRLDVIESLAEHEGSDPRSMFNRSGRARLEEIRDEHPGDIRSDLADAFLRHGADDLQVEVGVHHDRLTDDIVDIERDED